ncbi:ribonuclease P protein subunit p20 [Chelonus insularis]|uniref:ribonuclease P protein subunit p20 n=1 Tax=Chelonus insularis TaxID=460826 RepID=UPI00158939BE|nr:ribonuclease P protein subunit p20 [Chelonus insularis]
MADESEQVDFNNKKDNSSSKPKSSLEKNSNYLIKKRNPLSSGRKKNDVYVSNQSSFTAQLKKCEKLLDSGESEIFIHGLGAAISKACTLALQLQSNHHQTVDLDIETSTVGLTDDIIPLTDDDDYSINKRQNSAIHIRVFKVVNFGSLRYAKETKK